MAYLRTSVMNRIRDEARRVARRPEQTPLSDDLSTPQPSPLEMAVGQEALERYEAALEKLPEVTRQAVILRVEMGYTYSEIANAMRITSTDAARMIVTRALTKLAQLMRPPAGPGRLRE